MNTETKTNREQPTAETVYTSSSMLAAAEQAHHGARVAGRIISAIWILYAILAIITMVHWLIGKYVTIFSDGTTGSSSSTEFLFMGALGLVTVVAGNVGWGARTFTRNLKFFLDSKNPADLEAVLISLRAIWRHISINILFAGAIGFIFCLPIALQYLRF